MSKPMKNMTSSALVVQKDEMTLVNSLLRKCVNDSHQDATSRIAQLELVHVVEECAVETSENEHAPVSGCHGLVAVSLAWRCLASRLVLAPLATNHVV